MLMYSENEILQIAKRFNNKKRGYLLLNPLQAKHVPVSPNISIKMMESLGEQLYEKYPSVKLIIGFAETATAIGAVVANCFPNDCYYIHTTREKFKKQEKYIDFLEEHSHAAVQMLYTENLFDKIADTDTIIFVDDELSTGKTMMNIVARLKEAFPIMSEKKIIAASLLNRVSKNDEKELNLAGIQCEYLVKIKNDNFDAMINHIVVKEAETLRCEIEYQWSNIYLPCQIFLDPRKGIINYEYEQNCRNVAASFINRFNSVLGGYKSVLVLGTEECMYPGLVLGHEIEHLFVNCTVNCHATTRSPIGISAENGYPIISGYKIKSVYESERTTYIYNLQKYDAVIIVADNTEMNLEALNTIVNVFSNGDICDYYYIQGGTNVWYLQKR